MDTYLQTICAPVDTVAPRWPATAGLEWNLDHGSTPLVPTAGISIECTAQFCADRDLGRSRTLDRVAGHAAIRLARGKRPIPNRNCSKGAASPSRKSQNAFKKSWHTLAWARAGGCEELILQGRVSINGEVIRQLGTRVDRSTARITVDGETIKTRVQCLLRREQTQGLRFDQRRPLGPSARRRPSPRDS